MTDMSTPRPVTLQQREAIVRHVQREIRDRYADPDLTLEDVVYSAGWSRRSVQRALAPAGFRAMLTRHRMEVARRILSEQGKNVTVRQVAARVGYRQPAQMAKAYRRHHGHAPAETEGV
jgi:AraC family transcriptional regulator, regulatory protein of adaptative response / methylphosphotriester-DNA alkyltransferase methyltransferase